MGLYEPKKKIFIGGDHILADITPNIQLWSEDWDPLNEYLTSLEKVYWFDIELLLPGHRSMIKHGWQCKGRIEELKNHHKKRLAEIISILEKGGKSAFQVASEMRWDLSYDSWESFPVPQKWFATGEAIAHLKYLEEKGIVIKAIQEQTMIYSLNQNV